MRGALVASARWVGTVLRHVPLVLAVASAVPAAVEAQELVRGRVIDGGTSAPVEGAMVILLVDDTPVVSQLSGPDGTYSLRPPGPGRYTLRIDRIGYGSTYTDAFDVAPGEVLGRDVRVAVRAVVLRGLDVEGSARCRTRPDGGATALVWEEARKALAAATWTSDRELYRFVWSRYVRELDRDAERIRQEQRVERRAFTARPFLSRDATVLSSAGFVGEEDGGTVFYAPDAHVLLSESFLNDHCFALREKSDGDRTFVGLQFEPVSGRRLPDVRGVLWIDVDTRRLASLEYAYVNHRALPVEGRDAVGELSFRELPNGTWIVDQWSISMPRLAEVRDPRGFPLRYEVRGYVEEGGSVSEILTADGETVGTDRPAVRGVVVDSAGVPVRGTRVRLDARGVEVLTDADGSFILEDLADGTWSVSLSHPALERYGLEPQPVDLVVDRARERAARLELPTPGEIASARCAAAGAGTPGEAVLAGRLLDEGGEPIPDAEIRASWTESRTLRRTSVEGFAARSSAAGAFIVCDVPADAAVTVAVDAGTRGYAETVVTPSATRPRSGTADQLLLVAVDLTLNPRGGEHRSRTAPAALEPRALPPRHAAWLDSLGFGLRAERALWASAAPAARARRAATVVQVLESVPGLSAHVRANGRMELVLDTAARGEAAGVEACRAELYFNGSVVRQRTGTDPVPLDRLVRPEDVTALEVHTGATSPVGALEACASVLLWSWEERHADDPSFVGAIEGRVRWTEDPTGAAPELRVRLSPGTPAARAPAGREVRPGLDGFFRFEGIPPGRYRVEAEVFGRGSWVSEVDVRAGVLVETAITIGPR